MLTGVVKEILSSCDTILSSLIRRSEDWDDAVDNQY